MFSFSVRCFDIRRSQSHLTLGECIFRMQTHTIRCSKSLISIDSDNDARADTGPPLIIQRKSLHRCNGFGYDWDAMHSIRAATICCITSMTTNEFIIKFNYINQHHEVRERARPPETVIPCPTPTNET